MMKRDGGMRAGLTVIVLGLAVFAIHIGNLWLNQPGAAAADAAHAGWASPASVAAAVVNDGEQIYMTRCQSCHQMNGEGISGAFPPVNGSEWVTGDKGVLIRVILNGLVGDIKVKGEKYGGAMPPWSTFLNDEQVASLLTYLRTAWDNDAEAVTAEEVAAVRAAVGDRKKPWTAEELEKEENQGIPGI